jgi:hypothetical protein
MKLAIDGTWPSPTGLTDRGWGVARLEEIAMRKQENFRSLETETRAAVDTATAAFHLNRKPRTLRVWACGGSGPLQPVRINGRLAWPVEKIKAALRDGFVPDN